MKLNLDVYLHLSSSNSFPVSEKIKQLEFGKGLLGRLWLFAGSCGRLLVVYGLLLVVCDGLWFLLMVCVHLLVVCFHLWSFVVVACFSNYAKEQHIKI